MKILHTADWHADYNFGEFLSQSKTIIDYIKKEEIELFLFAGDLTDKRIYADDLHIQIINRIKEIAKLCKVIMIYGTPSHDYRGSLGALKDIENITLVDTITEDYINIDDTINIIPLPWPSKYRVLGEEEMFNNNIEAQNKLYDEKMKKWFIRMEKKYKISEAPVILLAHLQLIGSIPSIHQDISPDNHNPKSYFKICDYGALGHIHNSSDFYGENSKGECRLSYSGSIYNKTWGEMESKYFNVIEVKKNKLHIKKVKLDTPPMVKIELDYNDYLDYKKKYEKTKKIDDVDFENGKIWFKIGGDTKKLNKLKEIEWWNDLDISARIDINSIKYETIKREMEYTSKSSLYEKFKLWCNSKEITPTEYQIKIIQKYDS